MTKNKLLAFALVPIVTINMYAGSKFNGLKVANNETKESTLETSLEENLVEVKSDVKAYIPHEILSTEIVYNGQEVLDGLKRISKEKNKENISDELIVASDLYMKLVNSGIEDNDILRELDNMVVLGTTYTDFNSLSWHYLFGNLNSTISEYDNVYDVYYPLASVVHRYSCVHNHNTDEFGRISCELLTEKLWDDVADISLKKYLKDKVLETGNDVMILAFHRLVESDISFDLLLEELNNLYTFATIPTELDEENWNNLFGNLNSTLKDGEVLYDLYYDLALYFHETYCKYDHYYNECEVVTCDEVKLMLTY